MWGGDLKTLYLIERKLRAMISSMMIKRKNVSVLAWVISVKLVIEEIEEEGDLDNQGQ